MARQESEREDILREATALVERVEVKVSGFEESVIIGFRREGAASIFFGADPVYQFNTTGELRRAYVGGLLYKAVHGHLVSLRRERTGNEVALIRRDLDDAETTALMASLETHLSRLKAVFAAGNFAIARQVPSEADVLDSVRAWLESLPQQIEIAEIPNVQ